MVAKHTLMPEHIREEDHCNPRTRIFNYPSCAMQQDPFYLYKYGTTFSFGFPQEHHEFVSSYRLENLTSVIIKRVLPMIL